MTPYLVKLRETPKQNQYLVGDEGEVEVVELGAAVAGGARPVGSGHVLGKNGRFLKRFATSWGSVKFNTDFLTQ